MAVNIKVHHLDRIGRITLFHRKRAGLSRNALADLAGVGKTIIYEIEHGKTTVRLDTLIRVLATLNISVLLESPLMASFEAQGDAKR